MEMGLGFERLGSRSGEGVGLKREVGWFGSFAMGYGDVGADIFIALGIVTLYAGGAAPYAFIIAGLIYVTIGLAYAELAPTYPYAGGVQVYAIRASNTLMGFLAGWAILLDYTIDISLFSAAAAGYLKYLIPGVREMSVSLFGLFVPSLGLIAALLVLLLILINYIGIKYSAGFISMLVALGLFIQILILALGFGTAFNLKLFFDQIVNIGNDVPLSEVGYLGVFDIKSNNFLYGLTLAMASFIGIESIAQAAEETKRPHKWIPRAAKLCVVAVPLSVILFSVLSIGVLEWRVLGSAYENPVAVLVSRFPSIGKPLSLVVSFAAFVLCLASANTGVVGVSRLTASMGKFNLLPRWLYYVHPRFRTPTRTVLLFGLIGLFLSLPGDIPLLASLYNFGACLSYFLLMVSLLMLRSRDSEVHRPWKIPFSVRLRSGRGVIELPIIGLLGLAGTAGVWVLVVLLHPAGRFFGLIWMITGLMIYALVRRISHRPILSREERDLVIPAGYRMRVAVLVRPYDNPEFIKKSVAKALDKRFSLKLISVIDLPTVVTNNHKVEEIEVLRKDAEEALASISKELQSMGYETDYDVKLGDFAECLEEVISRGEVDFLAYIVRGFGKAKLEKGFDERVHSIMLKHPGKIMLLKRVTE